MNLSGKTKSSMGKSTEEVLPTNSPAYKKDRFANFKKSHISHSTGELNINNRNNLSLFGDDDVKLNDSQFFEVMYVGKIRVSHKKLPKSFIDDAIPKFIAHDKMKLKVRKSENKISFFSCFFSSRMHLINHRTLKQM